MNKKRKDYIRIKKYSEVLEKMENNTKNIGYKNEVV